MRSPYFSHTLHYLHFCIACIARIVSIACIACIVFIACIACIVPITVRGQHTGGETGFVRLLAMKGYENVRVARRSDTLFVGCENRVWRWEPRAAAEILKLVMPAVDSAGVVSLTLLKTGIPLTTLIVTRKDYDDLRAGRLPEGAFAHSATALLPDRVYRAGIGRIQPANPSFSKFDVVVYPQLRMQFGNFDHPLELQFNIAPAVRVSFWQGMSLTAQVIFPVYNNLTTDPEGNTIRPGLLVLSQSFRLPGMVFATLNAGYFTRSRYGLNGEMRKFMFNGKIALGAAIGYTSQMQFIDGSFIFKPEEAVTWFCDAAWRWARYDLTLRAGYGRFIGLDQGWRVDVSRQFGEVSIGFFAMQTGDQVNGGFNFIVPIPPRRYGTKNQVRIRPASYVPWEYRAKGLNSYGRSFSTGNGTDEMLFNLNPDYIRKQVGKEVLKL